METVNELKDDAVAKLRDAEKALHKWACALEVGEKRTYAFNLYEIIRTAPREAKP